MSNSGNFLVIVLDLNPIWWERKITEYRNGEVLGACIDGVISYSNAHMLMKSNNELSLIAVCGKDSKVLWPPKKIPGLKELSEPSTLCDGKLEQLVKMNNIIKTEIQQLAGECEKSECNLAPALSTALCCINKRSMKSRITVLKAADDSPAQYMHLMNIAFTAQKLGVTIDGIVINKDSQFSLLSQLCHVTGGVLLHVQSVEALLQHLLCSPLVETSLRSTLRQPAAPRVQSQVACACHKRLVHVGFVCSVCLSVFCAFRPLCSTCGTVFQLPTLNKPKISNQ